jgi:anthranilate phosphoribosyltransferase
MLTDTLEKLIHGLDLTPNESYSAMHKILTNTNTAQTSAFLALLRAKGETVAEVMGIIQALQENMLTVSCSFPVLDIVGTGGDRANTINISTAAGILAASCGVKIAKHGNRAITSHCGSADVLEALGCNIHLSPEQVSDLITQTNFGFCFAPNFNPALKKLRTLRTDLGLVTLFNVMGPFLNPARASYCMIGIYDLKFISLCATVLSQLSTVHSMVFHSDGIDELTTCSPAHVIEIIGTDRREYILDPRDFGFKQAQIDELKGTNAQDNADKIIAAFNGQEGAIADTLIFNAGVALYLYGKTTTIEDGITIAQEKLFSGEVAQFLKKYQALSHSIKTTQKPPVTEVS